MERIKNYIGGEMVSPESGHFLGNIDPATGGTYSLVPDSDQRDVDGAIEAAAKAFPSWSTTPVATRSQILNKIADAIDANVDRLAHAECVDSGKPLSLARSLEIPRAAANFRFFAGAVVQSKSESHATDNVAINYTLRKPRGVTGLISPWNLPLYLFTWKVAPAIAFGNTAVAKPSELTPMTAYLFSQLCREAGLPAGVLNVVHGTGAKAGAAIVAHPTTTTLSFTGGTATGREIARVAAPMFKKVALELGGKNPNIIFADADMDEAIAGSLRSSFANQGQVCLCGSRVFVERAVYDDFVARFVEATTRLRVGDPLLEDTNQGALVSRAQLEKVMSYIELARSEGGTICCGGGAPEGLPARCRNGFFVAPTVITDLSLGCRVNQEEIFGPVVTVTPFDREDEVIEFANGVAYGLSASVWTRDVGRAHRVADRIEAGTVWINCWLVRDLRVPFGGMKQSGVGREGGEEAMRFFTEPKNVCIKIPPK
jgi:aminomuconate-semialdehyde/2-hydroxymuconate-6-semialdehyde dehydrogenase